MTTVKKDGRILLGAAVAALPGIGPKRADQLGALGIATIGDLLAHSPRAYEDRSNVAAIADAVEGETITICASIVSARAVRLRGRMGLCEAVLRDDSGTIKATWFGRGFLARTLTKGARGFFSGQVGKYKGLALKNPEYELITDDGDDCVHTASIVPLYRLTEGVTQRFLRNAIHRALDLLEEPYPEIVPEALRTAHALPPADATLRTIHFPESLDAARIARNGFAYGELLSIQVGLLHDRATRHSEVAGIAHRVGGPYFAAFREALPFALTQSQEESVGAILEDMAAARPMGRLLQGDVGCGKTIVALHAVAAAADGGYQTAIMAPTEILAAQHAAQLRDQLEPLGLRIAALTGSTARAKAVRHSVARGEVHVVAGTHALIQASTDFHKLGLVIIDEQHRFGVMQRSALADKGASPDILQMTATPIPRTLAITIYGGMDLTLIDELPPGRSPVKTEWIREGNIATLHNHIIDQSASGHQTYYVCPLVEESDKVEWKAATQHFDELSSTIFSSLRTGLLHGQMGPDEKAAVMNLFKAGHIDVLFATTVIEVGVDVPNATTMAIENAGRFGLTQLHQLRGRVGRGSKESHCFLVDEPKTTDGRRRIQVMCDTNSGFDIAEEDLKLRGPGEFAGLRQAGLSDMRFADLLRDVRLLDAARKDAQGILEEDPHLEEACHQALRDGAARYMALRG
jgi:ATP-dependent DNA helicase RecG